MSTVYEYMYEYKCMSGVCVVCGWSVWCELGVWRGGELCFSFFSFFTFFAACSSASFFASSSAFAASFAGFGGGTAFAGGAA
jgi:hypothetical protein